MIRPARTPVDRAKEHLQALHFGSEVTRWFRKEREPNVIDVTPENVLAALHSVGVNCVLTGVHGFNVYRDEARATPDVDLLVIKKDLSRAAQVLGDRFPSLEEEENPERTSFLDPVNRSVVIDIMKPWAREVFRHTIPIGHNYRIPNLELALVSKSFTMTATDRRMDRKYLDAGDFTNMVETNRSEIDTAKLRRLAENVHRLYGKRIMDFIADIDAGRTIQL